MPVPLMGACGKYTRCTRPECGRGGGWRFCAISVLAYRLSPGFGAGGRAPIRSAARGGGFMMLFEVLLFAGFVTAPIVFGLLLFVSAPYGRHERGGWGPQMPSQAGWIAMEAVAVGALPVFFFLREPALSPTLWILLAMWEAHYIHRAFIYPLRMRSRGKTNPVLVVAMAMGFNIWNGYLNGTWLGAHAEQYTTAWLTTPQFLIGVALFLTGFGINFWADNKLLNLRKKSNGSSHRSTQDATPPLRGDEADAAISGITTRDESPASHYTIPRGGLYDYISCPNYFGEMVEWTGWAILTWSPAGVFFALWTAANLVPRAIAHHRWYRETFAKYPATRKAVVPFAL